MDGMNMATASPSMMDGMMNMDTTAMPSMMDMDDIDGHNHGSTGSSSNDVFCYAPGQTMSMVGFFAIGLENKGETQCINLLWEVGN